MWVRILFVSIVSLFCLGCVKEEASKDVNSVSLHIQTENFSFFYDINAEDQVHETITYDPTLYDVLDEVILAERRYVARGAYDKLVVSGQWANSIRSAPNKIQNYRGAEFNHLSRESQPIPVLTLWLKEGPLPGGRLTTARIPIPTASNPRNGLDRSWASERAWMGQMVGQFLDVVGPPKLNAEDYVNRVPEARRNQLPLKLNFSDYR